MNDLYVNHLMTGLILLKFIFKKMKQTYCHPLGLDLLVIVVNAHSSYLLIMNWSWNSTICSSCDPHKSWNDYDLVDYLMQENILEYVINIQSKIVETVRRIYTKIWVLNKILVLQQYIAVQSKLPSCKICSWNVQWTLT